jgi:hypothetical protein
MLVQVTVVIAYPVTIRKSREERLLTELEREQELFVGKRNDFLTFQ